MQIYGLPTGQVADFPGTISRAESDNRAAESYQLQKDALSEQKRVENTQWIAGAAKYWLDNWGQPGIGEGLMSEAKQRGIDFGKFDPTTASKGGVMKFYQQARTALGDVQQKVDGTAPMQNYAERTRLASMYGDESPQVSTFDKYVRAGRITDVAGVPTEIGAGGDRPLSTQESELGFVRQSAEAGEQGRQDVSGSVAQQRIDQAFAPTYIKFTTGGGFSDAQKGVAQLQGVQARLVSGENLTGWSIWAQPDAALALTNPEALAAREEVEEVVQRNLRLILGAQFTEKEGERLIARAWNPKLEEKFNIQRINRLLTQMQQGLAIKLMAINYFDQNQSLAGFQMPMLTMQDFYDALDAQPDIAQGDVYKGYQFIGGDPGDQKNWVKVNE